MTDTSEAFAAIIESARDAIISADAEGEIVTWNPAAERIFGYSEEEAVGRDMTLIIPERFHSRHHQGFARVVAGGETRIIGGTVEMAGARKDGSEFPIELSLATWFAGGDGFFRR